MSIKFDEAAVQAAIIVSGVTLLTVILGLIFKDFLIPGWVESRSKKRTGRQLLHQYRVNLFRSSEAVLLRLGEIYRVRSHYLWLGTPKNEFYNYKYRSSVYRLCALLGWIRAYRIQEALISFKHEDTRHRLTQAMDSLATALADGQQVEMYVAKAICKILEVEADSLPGEILAKFSVEIDELAQRFMMDGNAESISDLSVESKNAFVAAVVQLATFKHQGPLSALKQQEIVREVSVKVGLIYRDWQQAIGDLMTEKNDDNGSSYRIIGYKQFEKFWNGPPDSEEKRWIARAERIFQGLDLRVDHSTDSRIAQLRRVYTAVYGLLKELYNMEGESKPISPDRYNKILPEV